LTDKPADISDQTLDEPEGWSEGDDLPVAQVRELFVVFAKALRAFQLYDDNNLVRRRFVTNLRECFERLWQEIEGLNLSVEEHRFLLAGEAVYGNPSSSDSSHGSSRLPTASMLGLQYGVISTSPGLRTRCSRK
jgi:hypothetical protein